MSMITCRECKAEISEKAKTCPSCGAPNKARAGMISYLMLVIVAGIVISAMMHEPTPEEAAANAASAERSAVVFNGKEAVKARLNDPASARFGDVVYVKKQGGVAVACGTVNAKNGFGGYGGMKQFVSFGSPKLTSIEGTDDAFVELWNRHCAGK